MVAVTASDFEETRVPIAAGVSATVAGGVIFLSVRTARTLEKSFDPRAGPTKVVEFQLSREMAKTMRDQIDACVASLTAGEPE